MLKIKNLRAGYGNLEVIHGLDLDIKPGEILAIIGPNGAGKTTIFKSLFNLCEVYEGNIILDGQEISKLETQELIIQGINFVSQQKSLFSTMTVRENLEMGAYIIKDKNEAKQKVEDTIKKFPQLQDKLNEYAYTLSGGQQQILAIAKAIIQTPKILLLDEPSIGLSPKATNEIIDLIREINKGGVTIIIIEQNIKHAINIADKICLIENGKIILNKKKKDITKTVLKRIYFKD